MPEEISSHIDHATLEQEIEILAMEVREKTSVFHGKPEVNSLKGAIKESLRLLASRSQVQLPSVLPDYLTNASPEVKLKVEKLLDKVFHDGILKTINEAKKEGPFFLDVFHDALTGKLYDEMRIRKLL